MSNAKRQSNNQRGAEQATESRHLVHSTHLREVNRHHDFPAVKFPRSLLGRVVARLRRFLGEIFLGDYLEKQYRFNSELVRYLNQVTSHIDTELGDKAREEQAIFESRLVQLENSLGVIRGQVETLMEGETGCLLYTSPSPRDATLSRMPSSA